MISRLSKHVLLSSAALSMLCLAPMAAQASVQATAPAPDQAAPAVDPQASAVDDVVVTAQRRSENIQEVPVAITAITPQALQDLSIQSVSGIQLVTPALVYESGYSYSQTYVRGVGTNLPNPGLEGAVATYVDGAYLQRNLGTVSDLFDSGTIQVLKGPQGTLWGRNATGGAILISTANPTFEPSLRFAGEAGNLQHRVAEFIGNLPISDTLAVRLSSRHSEDDGYITNLFDGSKFGGRRSNSIRGKVLWQPTEDFTAILGAEYSTREESGGATAQRTGAPICLGCSIPGTGAGPVPGFYDTDNDANIPFTSRSASVNLTLRYKHGPFSFESVTAYRNENSDVAIDQDYSRVNLLLFSEVNGGKTFTQDFQVATDFDGMFNGLLGLSYLKDDATIEADLTGGAFAALVTAVGSFPFVRNDVETESRAVFGELYITPLEHLKITVGGRYTKDERTLDGSENLAANLAFTAPGSPLVFNQNVDFSSFTPRVVIAYDFGNTNAYLSYNKGFKAGGFATPAFGVTNVVDPEEIQSYEAGLKFVTPDRKLRINSAAFYYKYEDIQVSVVDLAAGGLLTENAARAHGYGFETDVNYALTSDLTLFGGLSLLKAEYDEYTGASVSVLTPTGITGGVEDLSGTTLQRAPETSGFIGANYSRAFGSWIANLNGVARYTSEYDFYPGRGGTLRHDFQPAYTVVNLTGSIGPADESYSVGFYVRNLTDEEYYVQRGTGQPFGTFDQVAQPRTYGVRLTAKF